MTQQEIKQYSSKLSKSEARLNTMAFVTIMAIITAVFLVALYFMTQGVNYYG